MNANFRIDDGDWQAFQSACATANVRASHVLRDLIVSATEYMGKMGKWIPPTLSAGDVASTQITRDRLLEEMIDPEKPLHRVLELVVDRVFERRQAIAQASERSLIAAESRPRYGGDAAAEPAYRLPVVRPMAQPHKDIPVVPGKGARVQKRT